MLLKEVSMQLFGMFIEVEAGDVEKRLGVMNPVILKVLADGVSSSEQDDDDDDDKSENEEDVVEKKLSTSTDKLLYNSLTCLGKLFSKPEVMLCNQKYSDQINEYLSKCVLLFSCYFFCIHWEKFSRYLAYKIMKIPF